MKKDTEESANINTGPRKETFLRYCKKLWATLSQKCIGIEKISMMKLQKMEELEEAIKKRKPPGEDNLKII